MCYYFKNNIFAPAPVFLIQILLRLFFFFLLLLIKSVFLQPKSFRTYWCNLAVGTAPACTSDTRHTAAFDGSSRGHNFHSFWL